jgi:hypothetical protein
MTDSTLPNTASVKIGDTFGKDIADLVLKARNEPPKGAQEIDAVPNQMAVHRERMLSVVKNATASCLDSTREVTDQLQGVARMMSQASDDLQVHIEDHVSKCDGVIANLKIMADALNSMNTLVNRHTVIEPSAPGRPTKGNGRRL